MGPSHRRGLIEDISTDAKSTGQVGILARTENRAPICLYVDFPTRMSVMEVVATGDDRDWVVHVVHPREVGDLRIEVLCPSLIPDARCSKRDTSDGRVCRQIKLHEE